MSRFFILFIVGLSLAGCMSTPALKQSFDASMPVEGFVRWSSN